MRDDRRGVGDEPPPGSTFVVVCAAVWVAVTAVFIEPLQAAFLNWDELAVDFPTLFSRLAIVAIVALVALVPLALVTRWLAPLRAPGIWTSLCVLLWLQGDLFAWSYGSFDGTPVDWSTHSGKAWLEGAFWLGVPALASWRARWAAKNAHGVLAAVVALQLVGLASAAAHSAPYAERPQPLGPNAARTREFASLSSRGNVILVVLDALQSDVFAEAMQSDELAARMPEGFVFYRNAVSLYTTTELSLQSILTSRAVPDGVDALAFRAQKMKESLPVVLVDHGFDSRLATIAPQHLSCRLPSRGLQCSLVSQLDRSHLERGVDTQWRAEVSLLLRLGIFRLVPHVLKSRVYDAGLWSVPEAYPAREPRRLGPGIYPPTQTDVQVLDRLASNVQASDVAPRFRFLHLNGVHEPAAIDARCAVRVQSAPRPRSVETAHCILRKLYGFLAALEDTGAYDESLIAVVSDHGSHLRLPVDAALAEPALAQPAMSGSGDVKDWWRGVPLFLVKEPRARGRMQISDRPVSLCDVPATVLDVLDIELDAGAFECESVRSPSRREPRVHFRYQNSPLQKLRPRATRYLFDFQRFRVDGHSWHPSSWVAEPGRSSAR